MKKWEHFHVALPVTEPPPDHTAKMLSRLIKEMRLTMSQDSRVTHLETTDQPEFEIPNIPDGRSAGVFMFMIGVALGMLSGMVIDWLYGLLR